MAFDPLLGDMIAFIVFIVLAVGYHVFYLVVMRHHLAWSVKARMQEHRVSWMETVLKRGERIMAVQTLRNLIMTNTFLASTMILLVAFIANFVVVNPSASPFEHPSPNLYTGAMPVTVKGILLLFLYAFAFVMFLTSLRNLNHLSILVGIEPDRLRATEQRDPALFLARKLNEVESMTTYGRRAVYFSMPVFTWFFSPWLFAITTVLMWLFFVMVTDFVDPFRRSEAKAEPAPAPAPGTPTK